MHAPPSLVARPPPHDGRRADGRGFDQIRRLRRRRRRERERVDIKLPTAAAGKGRAFASRGSERSPTEPSCRTYARTLSRPRVGISQSGTRGRSRKRRACGRRRRLDHRGPLGSSRSPSSWRSSPRWRRDPTVSFHFLIIQIADREGRWEGRGLSVHIAYIDRQHSL